jgi:hypothetical protein
MGAESFEHQAFGKDAKEAFDNAVEEALYDYGHSGYTGTIAEKDSFVEVGNAANLPSAHDLARILMNNNDSRIDDKWGPAGCIKVTDPADTYLFFGWASS